MPRPWSAKNRESTIQNAAAKEYDLIIIGGGITGAGVARECALRGISFCLLDKNDFAFGTSSRSSKLFHGGLRYLASGEFGLVRESTGERNWLRHHLPNLVRPLGFVYPSYQKSKATPLTIWLAVKLYDLLSNCFSEYKNYRKAKIFKAAFLEEFEPALADSVSELGNLTMAGFYYDTNCDDARVTLETIKESLDLAEGTSSALNYTQVTDYLHNPAGRVCGVKATDTHSGSAFEIRGKCVVSAAGIGTDEVLSAAGYSNARIYPTKGVHIVVPAARLGNLHAISLVSLDDQRFFFVLRRGPVSIIGTTDTAYYPESKDLDQPRCNREDCDYLLRTVNKMFPHAMLTHADIISAYAGIRPLIRQEGAKHESDVSRRHEIFATENGVVAIAGGKSTIFRRMAEDLLFYLFEHDLIEKAGPKEFHKRGFSKQPYKVGLTRKEFDQIAAEKNLPATAHPDQIAHFYTQYGRGGLEILEVIKRIPESGKPLLEGYPHCAAELVYILEFENTAKLIDLLCRRTEAQWMIPHHEQPELADAAATIMASYYGWTEERRVTEIETYLDYVANSVRFLQQ
jgi:glycerol-3-phosphate dehydrogenase